MLAVFIWSIQTAAVTKRQESNSVTKLSIAEQRLANNADEASDNLETYDAFSQAKADTVAYVLSIRPDSAAQLCAQWGLTDYYILDSAGQVQLSAVPNAQRDISPFTDSITTHKPVTAENGFRYYFSSLAGGGMFIGGRDASDEAALVSELSSVGYALKTIRVGTTGYMFAVNAADGTFAYHPDSELIGKSCADEGYSASILADGFDGWARFGSSRYYCISKAVGDNVLVAAVPEAELMQNAGRSTMISVLIFMLVISFIVLYAHLLRGEMEKHPAQPSDYHSFGKLTLNLRIAGKLRNIAVVGLIAVFFATFYIQTLAAYSRQSMISETKLEAVEEILTDNDKRIKELTDEYSAEYSQRAKNIAYTLALEPSLVSDERLRELAEKAQITALYVFDKNGSTVATNTNYKDFVLSNDENDQSFAFWPVTKGYIDEYVQPAQRDDTLLHNYI